MKPVQETASLFDQFKDSVLGIDPVYFCERNLVVDGKPLKLVGTGYKPFADIYRYIGMKAIEKDSKPVVLVKGRQVGATTMAAAMECYFAGCDFFGKNGRPPMRIIHLFPTLSLAAAYTKDKLDSIISQSRPVPGMMKSNGMLKSFMETRFDISSPVNNNMGFKKFLFGNQIWIDSTGLDGDRIRGRELCLETELPTPDRGFVKLKDLKEKDQLLDENSEPCTILKLHPIHESPESYRVFFDNGETVDACAEHLWTTECEGIVSVKNTKEILDSLLKKHTIKRNNPYKIFTITDIKPIDPKPMRCITVDSPSHLYLVTRSYIPTHNTVDCALFDECFPYDQFVKTNTGKERIGKLYKDYVSGAELPLVETYNENTRQFEYQKILKVWKRDSRNLVLVRLCNRKIKCTPNHLFLTTNGWVEAAALRTGDLILSTPDVNTDIKHSNAGLLAVESVENVKDPEVVYDLEVENNHNFIAASEKNSDTSGVIVHNCQDTPEIAIGAVTKILTQSRYGSTGEGIQVYFGTPKRKGGLYWNIWQSSTQNYFHLGCEKCGKLFPLYRPDVNWEEIWLYGFTVRCTECGHEQDKIQAQERGRWIPLHKEEDCKYIGYHINQLYIPTFPKEAIIKLKPENNPINTERIYMNEVLGEFHDGEGGTISVSDIQERCMDKNRHMIKGVGHDFQRRTYAGFDWGQRSALDEVAGRGKGQSFSCCVILTVEGNLFNVEFATKLNHNTPEYKIEVVEEMFRRYKPYLAVGDIGDAGDLTHNLQKIYDDKFLASRSSHKVIGHIKYSKEEWPKTIIFEKDYYISEIISLLKEGRIKFPQKSFEKISWLIQHCASMDIKVTRDKSGEPIKKYVKGDGPNDGLMALLNAYLAWKFDVTQGFSISNPLQMKYTVATERSPVQAVLGYVPKMFGGR